MILSAPKAVFKRTIPGGWGIISPIIEACFPVGWFFIVAKIKSAFSGGATMTNFPSLAKYNGSKPKISHTPFTSSLMGIAFS